MMPGPARYAKPPRLAALNRTANAGHQSKAHPWSGPVEHIPPHSGDRARSIVDNWCGGLKRLLLRLKRLGSASKRPPMMPGPALVTKRPRLAALRDRVERLLDMRSRPNPTGHITDRLTPVGRAFCMVGYLHCGSRDY
jgi:hypothetical protein